MISYIGYLLVYLGETKGFLDGVRSDPAPVLSGLLVGLILFLIFINDLPANINSFLPMTVSFVEILDVWKTKRYSMVF